jgi:hypothetical protein
MASWLIKIMVKDLTSTQKLSLQECTFGLHPNSKLIPSVAVQLEQTQRSLSAGRIQKIKVYPM